MLALRRWNIEVHNSRETVSRLLAILQDAGHVDLPKDWRTVLNRCQALDAVLAEDSTDERISHKKSYDFVTLVCGACWLAPFTDDQVAAAVTCRACGIATVQCSRLVCAERCVLVTLLGKKCVDTIKPCSVCLISSTSFSTHRSFHWSLANYIRDSFADETQCVKFIDPFRDYVHYVTDANGQSGVVFETSWYEDWLCHVKSSPVSTQLFHGDRFNMNAVWREHGPRSLIILLSIDWFPPFKSRDYTIGVLTGTVANLSTSERADRRNTWILSILEGPKEPNHLFYSVAPVFLEMRDLELTGLKVFDSLTRAHQQIFI